MLFQVAVLVAALLLTGGRASAEPGGADSIDAARELYAAAEYERALALLDDLRVADLDSGDTSSIEQYRAFCLLALGRAAEAEQAISTLVIADPSFQPADSHASPRVRTAFRDVRRRVLPDLIQRRYEAAKAAYDRKSYPEALLRFDDVLKMMEDPDAQDPAAMTVLADLRVLAGGFRDLASAAVAPPLPPAPAIVAPPKPIFPVRSVYSAEDADVVAPVSVRQVIPPFPLPSMGAKRGLVEVVINEKGSVENVTVRASLGERYDRTLLDAARQWKYQPATRGGLPVKYRKTVQVTVAPSP